MSERIVKKIKLNKPCKECYFFKEYDSDEGPSYRCSLFDKLFGYLGVPSRVKECKSTMTVKIFDEGE